MTGLVQVSTATETREQAVQLAQSLVRERLANGAQIVGPVTSVFWHNGEFGTGEEWQLLMKPAPTRTRPSKQTCWSITSRRVPRSVPSPSWQARNRASAG